MTLNWPPIGIIMLLYFLVGWNLYVILRWASQELRDLKKMMPPSRNEHRELKWTHWLTSIIRCLNSFQLFEEEGPQAFPEMPPSQAATSPQNFRVRVHCDMDHTHTHCKLYVQCLFSKFKRQWPIQIYRSFFSVRHQVVSSRHRLWYLESHNIAILNG